MQTIHVNLAGNTEEAATAAAEFITDGSVVLMPMDTSYGLAADATNPQAVDQVLRLKSRDHTQTLSVVVANRQEAERLCVFSVPAALLWEAFMPGPLTLVAPPQKASRLAPSIVSPLGIGLRQPDSRLVHQTADQLKCPFTATSANRSGRPSAYEPEGFLASLPAGLFPGLVIDGGPLPNGPSSTVVSVTGSLKVLREGAISQQAIESSVGHPHLGNTP